MKKICLLSSLLFLLQTPVAPAAPLLRMQFAADTDGAAPATASSIAGGTSTKPTALLNASGTSILIRTSPIDPGTFEMFEPGTVAEMNYSGSSSGPVLRFDGAAGDAASAGKLRVDLDLLIDSGTTWSGTVPSVVVRTGTLNVALKDLSDSPVCSANISLSTGQVNLVTSATDGSSPGSVLLGVAPLGDHIHLQVLLDYASGTASLTGDNLLYTPDPLAYTRTVSGSFASSRSFGRLDVSLAGGTGKVAVDNLFVTGIANLPERSVTYYGATGSGVDESAALQSAYADLGTVIGKLSFEAGKTYVISGNLSLTNRRDFLVEGNNATLKVKDGSPVDAAHRVLLFSNCENFTVQNLTINANRATRIPAEGSFHTIAAANPSLFRFINVHSNNSVCDAFYFGAGVNTDPETFPRNGLFLNCSADQGFRQGISLINGKHIAVVGGAYSNTIGTPPAAGIDLEANDGSFAPSHIGVVVRDAVFDSNAGGGIQVSNSGTPRNVLIEANSFFHDGEAYSAYGVMLGSSDSTIRNNVFENFQSPSSPNGVVWLKDYGTNINNKISYNWFSHIQTARPVIYISGTVGFGNQVDHNVITDYSYAPHNPISCYAPATTVVGNVTSSDPVGYWALDSSSGATMFDGSGNGLNGTTVNSPLWVSGTDANALSFNGTNQYGQLPSNALLNVTSHFTLAAWFKADSTSTTASHIVLGKNSDFRFGYSGGTNFGFYSPLTGWVYSAASKGVWHHGAVTFDGNRVRLYLDGNQVRDTEVKPGNLTTTSQAFLGSITGTTYPFHGLIDEVRVYNVVLSQAEIQDVKSHSVTP